jgi:hypothetical protein
MSQLRHKPNNNKGLTNIVTENRNVKNVKF